MPRKRKYYKQLGGEAPAGWGTPMQKPQIANCLVNTTAASSCGHAQRQASAKSHTALLSSTGAHGGGRRRRGGDTCATAPGVPNIAPTYAAGSSNQMKPNGNQNIANSLKLAASQQANASQDGTQGWAKVDNNKKGGGSALGNFVENLNNMSGGDATICKDLNTDKQKRRCRVAFEDCIRDRSLQAETIRQLKRENEHLPREVKEGDLLGIRGGSRRRRRRRRRKTRKRKGKKRRKRRRKSRRRRGGAGTTHYVAVALSKTFKQVGGSRKRRTRRR